MRFLRTIAILTGIFLLLGLVAPAASAATAADVKNLCGKPVAEQPAQSYVEFSEKGSGNSRTAILSAPGFINDKTQNDPLESTLQEYGDLVDVSFCGTRFFVDVVGSAMLGKIKQLAATHDNVVVVLTSMSGDFAPMIQHGLTPEERAKVTVLIMSSPSGLLTLRPKQMWQAGLLSLFTNDDSLEQSPARDFLLQLGLSANYGTNFQVDEARFMATFGLPWGSVAGFKSVTYFVSSNDETVNGEFASFWWNLAANGAMKKVVVESSHTGYKDFTANWVAALRPVLEVATTPPLA